MQDLQPKSTIRERGPASSAAGSNTQVSRAELSFDEEAPRGKPAPAAATPARRNLIAAAALAIVLAIGGGFAATKFWAPVPAHIGITTTTGLGEPYGGGAFLASDAQVTDKQWQERAAAFDAFKAKGPALLDRAETSLIGTFAAQAIADPQQRQALLNQINDKQIAMVAIGLYDDCAEDGDVVNVRSGPVNVFVPLKRQVQYVLVPVPQGHSAEVVIAGQSDGQGGGITTGMVTPGGVEHLPRLGPGQQISFAVR
jgi:hypothetical protein